MFNVDDKVVVKDNCGYWGFDGKTGVVVGVDNSDYPICVMLSGLKFTYLFTENELELVNNG